MKYYEWDTPSKKWECKEVPNYGRNPNKVNAVVDLYAKDHAVVSLSHFTITAKQVVGLAEMIKEDFAEALK
jgi:hypothetical protein